MLTGKKCKELGCFAANNTSGVIYDDMLHIIDYSHFDGLKISVGKYVFVNSSRSFYYILRNFSLPKREAYPIRKIITSVDIH